MKKILHIEGKCVVHYFEERVSFGYREAMADVKCPCGNVHRIIYNDLHKTGYAITRLNAWSQINPSIKRKLTGPVSADETPGKNSAGQLRLF